VAAVASPAPKPDFDLKQEYYQADLDAGATPRHQACDCVQEVQLRSAMIRFCASERARSSCSKLISCFGCRAAVQELAKDRTFKVTLKPQQSGTRPLQMFIGAVLGGSTAPADGRFAMCRMRKCAARMTGSASKGVAKSGECVYVLTGDAEGKALVQAFSGWKWHQQVVYRRQMLQCLEMLPVTARAERPAYTYFELPSFKVAVLPLQGCKRPLTYDFLRNVVESLGRKVGSETAMLQARLRFQTLLRCTVLVWSVIMR
jgi:hypothetical protein